MAPENGWFEDYFPFGMAYFQGLLLLVSGRVVFGFGDFPIKRGFWNPKENSPSKAGVKERSHESHGICLFFVSV